MSQFFCTIRAASSSTVSSAPHISLRPETKSVYWLDPPSSDSGSHLDIDGGTAYECQLHCGTSSVREPFFIGGFQLISNARQIDVFLVAHSKAISEENGSHPGNFLTSIKGISVLSEEMPKLFKAQCVIPGGPRFVHSVRLVFHSIQASADSSSLAQHNSSFKTEGTDHSTNGSITFQLRHIRWTLRTLSVTPTVDSPSAIDNSSNQASISDQSTIPSESSGVSADNMTNIMALMNAKNTPRQNPDVMTAVSGLAMALKITEERLQQQVHHETSTVHAQATVLSRQMETLTVAIRRMELNQQEHNSVTLSRQQHLEDLLNAVLSELHRAKVSPVETAATDGEEIKFSFVHESVTR